MELHTGLAFIAEYFFSFLIFIRFPPRSNSVLYSVSLPENLFAKRS